MKISIIVAIDQFRVIGKDNQLPWHLPADLKYFKSVTLGKPVVMGRKTFESIGKPLPGRENVIISRNPDYQAAGTKTFLNLAAAFDYLAEHEEIMVLGGAEIFKLALPMADRLYITEIHQSFDGDTYFPEIDENLWQEVSRDKHSPDEKNHYAYDFVVLEKSAR